MEITLKLKEHQKYLAILQILSNLTNPKIKPFCDLRNRELEVYAILLYFYNEKYKDIPETERNQLIFSYDARLEISSRLDGLAMDTVYNLFMDLRKKGVITKKNFIKKFIIPDTEEFKLKFIK
jgi:hypothetical protein